MMEIETLLKRAVAMDASDLFIIAGYPCSCKMNGQIISLEDHALTPQDTQVLIQKIYDLAPQSKYDTFMETGDDDFSFSIKDVGRFRINAYMQRNSQAAVLRIVKFSLPNPKELCIPDTIIDLYNSKKGLILVSGPAGSGKSTTLACLIDKINSNRNTHIITIEDPIEYLHSHKSSIVSQREVYHDTKSYACALRAALREAPEVILVGEMRDLETITTAITAAETGHLILSSLHTIGAANTIDRMIDVFQPEHQQQIRVQLSMVIHALVSEQLVPDVHGNRIPVFEIMMMNQAIRTQIREGKSHMLENTMSSCRKEGMITMDDALYNLYEEGRITDQTAVMYSTNVERMQKRIDKSKNNIE